jgi:diguanylate cyclase (GGDEF)-like protein
MLAQRWGFKEELVLAIFYHHTTSIPPNINSQQAIMISTAYLAHLMLEVFRSKSKKEPFDLCVREANKRFNFSEDTVHHLLENIGRESADIAGSFDFKCNLSTSYTELLKTLSLQLGEMNLTYEQMVRELRKSKAEAERLAHQLRIANEQLKKRADLDGLTGIFNHRYFQEHLAVEFMRARRYKSPLALIIIDVDFFKKVNDNYGHQVGDEVLRSIARILKKNTRISDIVARYGGEEFVLMLPETLLDQAYIVAEKIRAIIEREQMHIGQSNVNVTVSAGVSAMEPGQSYETAIELINVADKKLYRAKHSGRNLVVK